MSGEERLSTQFQLVEGSQVIIADETGNDFRDAALIVRDFLHQTNGRTEEHTIAPGKQAESIALQLELAVDQDEKTVTLSRSDFVCLKSLLVNYEEHGYGRWRLLDSDAPPVQPDRHKEMAERYEAVVQELFPVVD